MLTRVVLVGVGGALGAIARYGVGGLVHRFMPPTFPYGTFLINASGCLLFGVIAGLSEQRAVVGPAARTFLLIGVLGGYTTFSTFGFETFGLLRDMQVGRAVVNAGGQVVVGVFAVWFGYVIARAI